MFKKSLAVGAAALLATAATLQPALAQYQTYDPYYQQYDQYQNQDRYYQQQQSQYERDRAYYERQYNGQYQYQYPSQPYPQPYYGQQPYYGTQPYAPPPPYGYQSPYAYRLQDDPYYRECRQTRAGNQVAGLIIGGLAGAALGSTIARGPARGSGTAIGAILGGALGAGIAGSGTRLNCDDRNYVYNTYYSGFERGIPRQTYRWRNPRTGNYGTFYVSNYYTGQQGYRCANYTQTIWVNGRPVPANGYACRQPDGNWVIMN
jgi:surface antigen